MKLILLDCFLRVRYGMAVLLSVIQLFGLITRLKPMIPLPLIGYGTFLKNVYTTGIVHDQLSGDSSYIHQMKYKNICYIVCTWQYIFRQTWHFAV